ncbi:hypothetical protein B7494_g537 [Chlorociboria aeruginascens]|nr:hypothetical protein B7494_g537 [Chlorociboria aeruginascens]
MGLFDNDHGSKANHTCPVKTLADPTQQPLVGNMSFQHLAVILCGAFAAFTCLVTFFLIMKHATHFSIPKEQKQLIRIIFTIPVFAVVSLLAVAFEHQAQYITPLTDLYESFAFAAFFLLLCAFVQEDDAERQDFLREGWENSNLHTLCVFQFPFVMVVVFAATEITQAIGIYCAESSKLYFAHVWISIIRMISTGLAITSLLKFYKSLKPVIDRRKPLSKLVTFKGIVFLDFLQTTVFSFLSSSSDLHPTSHLTYLDLTVGIPALITSAEMVIFSLVFLYIYRSHEYDLKTLRSGGKIVALGRGGYKGGLFGIKALLQAANIFEWVGGMISMLTNGIVKDQYESMDLKNVPSDSHDLESTQHYNSAQNKPFLAQPQPQPGSYPPQLYDAPPLRTMPPQTYSPRQMRYDS